MSIVIGWFLVTCPWSNSNVTRPGYNCAVVARTPSLFVKQDSQENKTNCFPRDHAWSVYCAPKTLMSVMPNFSFVTELRNTEVNARSNLPVDRTSCPLFRTVFTLESVFTCYVFSAIDCQQTLCASEGVALDLGTSNSNMRRTANRFQGKTMTWWLMHHLGNCQKLKPNSFWGRYSAVVCKRFLSCCCSCIFFDDYFCHKFKWSTTLPHLPDPLFFAWPSF